MHGDAFGQFNQQKSARTAFSNFSVDGEPDAGGGSGRPPTRSSVAAASLPAAAASSSHLKLPARAAYPAPAHAAASSGSSSARRASVTFSPASTKHTYTAPPSPNNATHHGEVADDHEEYHESEQVRGVVALPRPAHRKPQAGANDSPADDDEHAVRCIVRVVVECSVRVCGGGV